jgi:hypothetical protein
MRPQVLLGLFGLAACQTPTGSAFDLALADRASSGERRADLDRDTRVPAEQGRHDTAAGRDAGGDLDGDGIPDAEEHALAQAYLPHLSLSPQDACPRHGVLFRLAPHPKDKSKLALWYVVLYERDCGGLGHVGDDEVFGALVDPKLPPPAGLLALRAISHQGTLCEKRTSCGSLPGCEPCATAPRGGVQLPVVFASLNKHGGYVKESTCDLNVLCDFGGCALNPQPSVPPLVNAGEPGKPLVTDLTAQGFITQQNGWGEAALEHFDPWGGASFGGAGRVSEDLVDPAFLIDPAGCP